MVSGLDDENERFRERYATSHEDAMVASEREVLGSDYQANGYTTRAQADLLGDLLELGPGVRLVDVGTGCGWPGLYLSLRRGCEVVAMDPVAEGAGVAAARAAHDGLDGRAWVLRGDAVHLPLAARCADAVLHTDVLC